LHAAPITGRDDADPCHVYQDVLIALDQARGLNNRQPSLSVSLLDQMNRFPGEYALHLGCGTDYYSAILAEPVGFQGSVSALEIAARSRTCSHPPGS